MTHYFSATSDSNVLKELRDAIYRGKCMLLAGCGLSTQVWTEDGRHPSDWKSSLERMVHWCFEKGLIEQEITEDIYALIREGFLLEAGQEIEEHLSKTRQQHQCLREALLFDQVQVSEIHRLIVEIPFRAYLTTNYDTAIETAYSMFKSKSLERCYETSTQDALAAYREDRPFILKLNGDIANPDTIILSDRAFEKRLHRASNYWRDLEKLLAVSLILCIGFGKADHDLVGFLNKIDVFNASNRHWMVIPEAQLPRLKAKRLQEDKGIRIIQYKDDETHSELIAFLKELAAPLSPIRLASEQGERINRVEVITEVQSVGGRYPTSASEGSQKGSDLPSSLSASAKTIEVFYSYATEDENLRKNLEKQLSILRRNGLITNWYPLKISAGEEWEQEINKHLNTARIILLLISSDFLASDPIYEVQIPRAIERHYAGEARVIPVLLREVFGWEDTPFGKTQLGKLQPLPKNRKFVTSSEWKNLDEAFADVAQGIQEAIKSLDSKPF